MAKKQTTKKNARDGIDAWTSNGNAFKNVKFTDKQKKAANSIKNNKKK